MSPFSNAFRELRIFCGLRQAEFAEKLGFEQSYISAIEIGTKGPPGIDFVNKLIIRLNLEENWQKRLFGSLEISQRKMLLPSEAPEDVYKMFNELRRQLDKLHPSQVELIQMALRLPESMTIPINPESLPPRRKIVRNKI
ncbi:helix-turn-helix domain-containing protein [Undibacterium sp. SXout11W]|uniref:helix-turn-helix domain-containing protein n=1 Tax=Undibacterium sp. SXout11W TaxID=3413050 RepID=UPI003BF0BED0